MDMIKPELHVVQQIRRDKCRVEQINDFPNTWDHHHHQNIKVPNNLGLIGVLQDQISVPVQTNAYQDCTTTFMNNPQGSSNWRSIDLSVSQPSSMNCSVVNYGYDQDGIRPSINVGDMFSNHFSSRNQILDRTDYAGRDTMVHSCLEDNQKDRVTVACSGTGNEILKSSQGSSSGSHRGELLFLPSLEDQSVAHNASRWNHGLSSREPLNFEETRCRATTGHDLMYNKMTWKLGTSGLQTRVEAGGLWMSEKIGVQKETWRELGADSMEWKCLMSEVRRCNSPSVTQAKKQVI